MLHMEQQYAHTLPRKSKSAIDAALHDPATVKKLALNQERFLRDYTYKRDGYKRSQKSCSDLIMEMAN